MNCTHKFVQLVLVDFWPEYFIYNYLTLHSTHVVDVWKGIRLREKTLLQYSSLTPLERDGMRGSRL